jgi:prevent-host-death family protein
LATTIKARIKDLRLRSAEILAAADRGETVEITYHGRARAVLTGVGTSRQARGPGRNPAFGLWRDRDENVAEQVREWRRGRRFDAG